MPMMTLDSWRLTEISENALHGKICSRWKCSSWQDMQYKRL